MLRTRNCLSELRNFQIDNQLGLRVIRFDSLTPTGKW
jgi:hypothetical protein